MGVVMRICAERDALATATIGWWWLAGDDESFPRAATIPSSNFVQALVARYSMSRGFELGPRHSFCQGSDAEMVRPRHTRIGLYSCSAELPNEAIVFLRMPAMQVYGILRSTTCDY